VVPDQAGAALTPKERVLNLLEVEEEDLTKKLGDVKKLIAAVRGVEVGARD
jgi:hypothetical protein